MCPLVLRTRHYIDIRHLQMSIFSSSSLPQVENVQESVAVSGNFVNSTNIREAELHFRINALRDPRTADLLHQLAQLKLVS